MQNDEVIWQVINHGFCSFKSKIARERTFCQNPYNVTGLCLRSACPLANSQYATIREEEGVCYLYIKTIERAHTPKYLWEKIKLSDNYMKALQTISTHLEYFPKYLVHRNKQRLTKIHEMLARMRKLKLEARPKLVPENTKIEQREKGREAKALKAAQLEKAIEKELLERLKQADEDQIVNYPEVNYNKVLNKAAAKFKEKAGKAEQLEDPDELAEDEEEEREVEEEEEEAENLSELQVEEDYQNDNDEDDEEYNIQYVEDFEESDDEIEDLSDKLPLSKSSKGNSTNKRKRPSPSSESLDSLKSNKKSGSSSEKKGSSNKKRKGPRVEIEYEHEEEDYEEERGKMKATNALENMDFNF